MYAACTLASIRDNVCQQLCGVADLDGTETMGVFAIKLKWRWWVYLTFGWYQERASKIASELISTTHTAAGVIFLGAW